MNPSPLLAPSALVYQFRIVIRGISPMVWRRLLIEPSTCLYNVHRILQTIFGWSDIYLHRFRIHGTSYGREERAGEERERTLQDFQLRAGEHFCYEYNYCAWWRVDLRLEAIRDEDPRSFYPVCIGGHGAAPPEDCKGAWAYLEELARRPSDFPSGALAIVARTIK